MAAASSWTTTSTAAAASGSRTPGRIARSSDCATRSGASTSWRSSAAARALAVGRGDQPRPGGLQLAQPLLLLLLQPEVGHGQPDGAGDGRGRRPIVQHRRAMGHDRDRPVRAVHGQPPSIPGPATRCPRPSTNAASASRHRQTAEIRVAEDVAEHHRQPVQPGQLSLRQERIGQPRPLTEHEAAPSGKQPATSNTSS